MADVERSATYRKLAKRLFPQPDAPPPAPPRPSDRVQSTANEMQGKATRSFLEYLEDRYQATNDPNKRDRGPLISLPNEIDLGAPISLIRGGRDLRLGITQAAIDAGERMGVLEPGTLETWTASTKEEQDRFQQVFEQEYGEDKYYDLVRMVGATGPAMAVPGMAAATAPAKVALGTVAGVAGGATVLTDTPEERNQNMILGGALGAGLSSINELIPAVKNAARRWASGLGGRRPPSQRFASDLTPDQVKPIPSVKTERQIDRGFRVMERTGVDLKPNQIAPDDVRLQSTERLARTNPEVNQAITEIERRQPKQLLKFFKQTAENLDPSGSNFSTRIRTAFNRTLGTSSGGGMLGTRASQAKMDFAAALGEKDRIILDNFMDKADTLIRQGGTSTASPQAAKVADELQEMITRIKSTASGGGDLVDAQGLQQLLEQYGDASTGAGKLFSREVDKANDTGAAKALFKALQRDLDVSADAGSAALKRARDNYRNATAVIDDLRESAVGKVFDLKGAPTDKAIREAFVKMDADEVRKAFSLLEGVDPSVKPAMQRMWLEDAITKSNVGGDAASFPLATKPFQALREGDNRAKFNAVFDTAEVRQQVQDGIEAARRIITNNAVGGGRAQSSSRLKELAGVMASQDRTFVARLGAELFVPKRLAKLVTDPEGIEILRGFSDPAISSTKLSATISAARTYIAENFEEE